VTLVGCSGPQALNIAINPQDQDAYLAALSAADGDARRAFVAWMAKERGQSPDAILTGDAELSTTRNPFDAYHDRQAVSRGAVIYQLHCTRCHGFDARGEGPAVLPDHPATNFKTFGKRFASTLHRGAPKKWFAVISDGSGDVVQYPYERTTAMPAFGAQLTHEQIWLVITYLQSLDLHATRDHSGEGP